MLGEKQRATSSGLGTAQRRRGGKDEDPRPEWRSELPAQIPADLLCDPGGGWVRPAHGGEGKSLSDRTARMWKPAGRAQEDP